VNELKSKTTPNDVVLILLSGHGSLEGFQFADGVVRYSRINETLNGLKYKVMIIHSNACNASIAQPRYMSGKNRIFTNPGFEFPSMFPEYMKEADLYGNKDGYCSLREAMVFWRDKKHPENIFYDPYNISGKFYWKEEYLK